MSARPDDNTAIRILALVEQSAPSTTRPRLEEERERALDEVERKTAGCYAQMDDMKARMRIAREELTKGPPHVEAKRQALRSSK